MTNVADTAAGAVSAPELIHGCPVSHSRDQLVVHPRRAEYIAVIKTLMDEGFDMAIDLCGVDYLEYMGRALPDGVGAERFEVVVNLLDMTSVRRLRIRLQVSEHDCAVPSLFELFPGTEAMEREAYDMFGIVFSDHPDPTRILMPEDWIGHPLRKDYDVGRIPVQFKAAHS